MQEDLLAKDNEMVELKDEVNVLQKKVSRIYFSVKTRFYIN